MKVLWPHNFNPKIDEAGLFMKLLAGALRHQGIKVDLFYLGDIRKAANIMKAITILRSIYKKYDITHAQYGSMCGLITSLASKNHKVLTLRGSDWHFIGWGHGMFSIHSFLATALTRLSLRKWQGIITVSKRIKRELYAYEIGSKICVLPSGIDLDKFVPREKRLARNLLGLNNVDDFWVLFSSINIKNPIKRQWLAEESIIKANKMSSRKIILRIANRVPHEKMPLLVSACDLVLNTSIYEGWPNIIKEGLACNVPFVSTDVSDLAEISEREECCRVCPAEAAVIAENIVQVLSDSKPRDLRKYVYNMDLKIISKALIEIYENILSLQCSP